MAATSGAIRAGRAFVEIFADDSKLARGLTAAHNRLNKFGDAVVSIGRRTMAIGAGITVPLLAAAKTAADAGSQLVDMGQRVGMTAEELSTLRYAAGQTDTSMETLESGILRMLKTITEARDGSKEAADALNDLGLSARQLVGLTTEQKLLLIADRIAAIPDAAARATAAMKIFGKGAGPELLPLLSDGAAGIEKLQSEAVRLGLQMSTENAQAAEKFGDSMQRIQDVTRGLVVQVGAELVPILDKVSGRLTDAAGNVSHFIAQHPSLVEHLLAIGAGATAAGAAILAAGKIVHILAETVLLLKLPLQGVSLLLTGVHLAGTLATATLGALNTVVALGPAGILLLVTALADLTHSWGDVKAAAVGAKDHLAQTFGSIADDAKSAAEAITAAFKSGNMEAAFGVVVAFIRLEFERLIADLEQGWNEFQVKFMSLPDWMGGMKGVNRQQADSERNLRNARINLLETQFTKAKEAAGSQKEGPGPASATPALSASATTPGKSAGPAATPLMLLPVNPDVARIYEAFTDPNTTEQWKPATNFFADLAKPMGAGIAGAWDSIKDSRGVESMTRGARGVLDLAGSGASAVAGAVGGSLSKIATRVAKAVGQADESITTGGTFSGLYAAQQLGVGNVQKEIAKNTGQAVSQLRAANKSLQKIKLPRIN